MQTTDKVAGNYAVEIVTTQGDNNGSPVANSGQIQNGSSSCSGPPPAPCTYIGGYPFANPVDTLEFWYKYVPMGNDSAQMQASFRNSTQNFWLMKNLGASANYQKVDIPFNLAFTPDTVFLQVQSSKMNDTALTYVGSDLKVDEMHFKSQPLSTSVPTFHIENEISIYPNPSTGEFNIVSSLFNVENVEVYNAVGDRVISKNINSKSSILNLRDEGIYFVKMNSNGKTFTKKLIVNR
jgi:hypothetical protein